MNQDKHLTLIFAGEEQRAPNSFYGPIVRHEYIMHYIMRGEGYVEIGNKTVKVCEGQTFILFPDELAKYYADANNPWHYIWANFNGEIADKLISQTGFTPNNRVSPPQPLYEMYPLYRDTVNAYYGRSEPLKSARLHLLLAYYTELFPNATNKQQPGFADKVIEFMQNHFTNPHTNVEWIAQRLNVSRSQLFRVCKEKTQQSPIQYLTGLRIEQAKYWLITTDHTITDIANSTGFEDAMYFSRLFTEKTGMTPTLYRKTNKT